MNQGHSQMSLKLVKNVPKEAVEVICRRRTIKSCQLLSLQRTGNFLFLNSFCSTKRSVPAGAIPYKRHRRYSISSVFCTVELTGACIQPSMGNLLMILIEFLIRSASPVRVPERDLFKGKIYFYFCLLHFFLPLRIIMLSCRVSL